MGRSDTSPEPGACAPGYMLAPLRGFGRGVAAILLLVLVSCQSPEEPQAELETVDVPPILTIDIEQDEQEPERVPELVGVLPGDFPADLPLYAPSSLVDFGEAEGGRYVTLLSPHVRSQVAEQMRQQLRAGGWTVEPDTAGSMWLRKAGKRVRLVLEDSPPGSTYRFEY